MDLRGDRRVWVSLALAAVLWYLVFGLRVVNFWLGMSLAVVILSAWAWRFGGPPWRLSQWGLADILLGVAAAAVLYGVFFVGNFAARLLFDFAGHGIAGVYSFRSQADPRLIALVLLFVTSPGEEIFWRGYLQRGLSEWWIRRRGGRRGPRPGPANERRGLVLGWLSAGLLYAAVHISSGNPMLVLAALVAGLFWGLLFAWRRSLVPAVVSHALWAILVFVVAPLG